MKTLKLILAAVLIAITVYSCSNDREDENVNQTSTLKLDLKKLKTNNNNQSSTAKEGDTIIGPSKSFDVEMGTETQVPVNGEGGDPKDVIPPHR